MGSIPMDGSTFRDLVWTKSIKPLHIIAYHIGGEFFRPWWDFQNRMDELVKPDRRRLWASGFLVVASNEVSEID